MSIKPNLEADRELDLIQVVEECSRCSGMREDGRPCDKLLMKIKMFSSFSDEVQKLMAEKNISISKIMKGIEIKIGIETKCNRCKNMNYELIVI